MGKFSGVSRRARVSAVDVAPRSDSSIRTVMKRDVRPGERNGHTMAPVRPHAALITRPPIEDLRGVPFHGNGVAPLRRYVLAGTSVHPEAKKHIVAHQIHEVSAARRSYCEPHVHDCHEIDTLLSQTSLSYEIRLGDDVYVVDAPATIYIPAGLVHSANVIDGSGFFIAMLDTTDYAASVRKAPWTVGSGPRTAPLAASTCS